MLKSLAKYYISSFKGLPRNAWLLSLVVLINRSGGMVLFFLSLYLTKELGYSVSTAGLMISVFGVGSLTGAILGGWLTDKIGTGKVMFSSLFFSGFAFIILGLVQSVYLIGIMVYISSVFSESFRPANAAAFAEVCTSEVRARGYVLNRMAINLGVTIGPAVGGFLAMISYSYLFWIDGLTCIIAALVFWFLFHDSKGLSESHTNEVQENTLSPYNDKIFLIILLFFFAIGICFIQLFNTWPLYHKEVYGFDEDLIGILLAINAFVVVLIEMPLIHRIEKEDNFPTMILGALLLFAGFSILPYGSGLGFAIFAVLLWTSGEILIFPLMTTFIANRASDKTRGKYMGMYTFTFSLAYVFGPVMGTYFYQIEKTLVFYLLQILGLITTIGFILLAKKIRSRKTI